MRYRGLLIALAVSLICRASGGAGREYVAIDLVPVPSAVAGTLSPLALSVDGKMLFREPRAFAQILINGATVPTQDDARRAFFFQSSTDKIVVLLRTWNEVEQTFVVDLPCVEQAKYNADTVFFKLCPTSGPVFIDGRVLPIQGRVAKWRPPPGKSRLHTLEMRGTGDIPDRLYNFRVVRGRQAIAVMQRQARERSLASTGISAAGRPVSPAAAGFDPFGLRVGVGGIFPSGMGQGFGGELAWAPENPIDETLSMRAHMGLAFASFPTGLEAAFIGEGLASYLLNPTVAFEGGLGFQVWGNLGGFTPTATVQLAFPFDARDGVRNVTLGYTVLLSSPMAHNFRLGVTFGL